MKSELAKTIEIGFPTRNRWSDVRRTLSHIADFGLGGLTIRILDDGSDEPCPFDVKTICPHAVLERHEESKGMIVRRNQIARAMSSRYYLGIDDDSYPAKGSLENALHFAESKEDLFSLAFPIWNPVTKKWQVKSASTTPYPVRSFIGCGHMMRRDRFMEMGGFQEILGYFFEEPEVSTRAFLTGLRCYHFPELLFHHEHSNVARNWYRMDYYGARNNILLTDWYVPDDFQLLRHAKVAAIRAYLWLRTLRSGHLSGQFQGVRELGKERHLRQRMTREQYARWRKLPD